MSGLLERFHQGDRQALARILTNVENQTDLGREALHRLSPGSGRAYLVGLTGPPGAGKSTLAHRMVQAFRRQDKTVAVLAIDPSSPLSGGATLGDRIRMLESQDDSGVFLRSMATRGQVGGLAVAAFGAALVLDAFGFDIVLIETVGTGQDEVDIAGLADTVLLIETPALGDTVQTVKAGILEIADIIAVNKADQPGADEVVRDLRQSVRGSGTEDWRIVILPLISEDGTGVGELIKTIEQHRRQREASAEFGGRRQRRLIQHARMIALHQFGRWLSAQDPDTTAGNIDPAELANDLLCRFARDQASDSTGRLSQ